MDANNNNNEDRKSVDESHETTFVVNGENIKVLVRYMRFYTTSKWVVKFM